MKLTIHLGAGIDTVTINGVPFDRKKMKPEEKREMRRRVVDQFAFEQRQSRRRAKKKAHA